VFLSIPQTERAQEGEIVKQLDMMDNNKIRNLPNSEDNHTNNQEEGQ